VPFDTSTPARGFTRRPSNSETLAKYVATLRARPASQPRGVSERRLRRLVLLRLVLEQLLGALRELLRRPPLVLRERGHRVPAVIQLDEPALDPEHLAGDVGGGVARQERHHRGDVLRRELV